MNQIRTDGAAGAPSAIPSSKAADGFALLELMLVVGVVSILLAIASGVYYKTRSSISAEEQGQRAVELAADIRRFIGKGVGTYAGLTPAMVANLGLVRPPFRWDGTNIRDAWGNTVALMGQSPWVYSMTLGGATSPISASDCAAVASRLANTGYAVLTGASVYLSTGGASAGWVQGGYTYKYGNQAVTQSNMTTGCAEANTVVGVTFLER